MTAIRFHGRGDIRLDHLEEPPCGKGEVKVSCPKHQFANGDNTEDANTSGICRQMRPAFVGICGSGTVN